MYETILMICETLNNQYLDPELWLQSIDIDSYLLLKDSISVFCKCIGYDYIESC